KTRHLDAKMLTATVQALHHAIPFLPVRDSGRRPVVLRTDALAGIGIAELWSHVHGLFEQDLASGRVRVRRMEQQVGWMKQAIAEGLQRLLNATPGMDQTLADLTEQVRTGRMGALKAAEAVLEAFRTDGARLP
ncbi:MAG TPA: hypothetical protein PKJ19_05350, partial [Flavobacteriales bacterium]|nr:hypothetical protein [Flavobacteriales bacterium]